MIVFRAKHAEAYEAKSQALKDGNKGRPKSPFRGYLVRQIQEEGAHEYAARKLSWYKTRLKALRKQMEERLARMEEEGGASLDAEAKRNMWRRTVYEVKQAWNL